MLKAKPLKISTMIIAVATLVGCATPSKPQLDRVGSLSPPTQWQNTVVSDAPSISGKLMGLVDDPTLLLLVAKAQASNSNLQQLAIDVRVQQRRLRSTDSAGKPTADIQLGSQRGNDPRLATNHNLALNVGWEVDVWGRLADSSEAATVRRDATKADLAAAKSSLAAQVIEAWVDINFRHAIIEAESQRILSLINTEEIITARFRDGMGNLSDLEAARATTQRSKASLTERQQAQAEALGKLNLLLGRLPQQVLPSPEWLAHISMPRIEMPSKVMAARPDLRAAYLRIQAADKDSAVAYKSLLPSFNLTASLSQARPNFDDLLSGSSAWNLLGQLTAPLFNAGRLRAEADIAHLNAERAYLDYKQTLLLAMQEVESSIGQEASFATQQDLLDSALKHSETSLEYYRTAYAGGLVDILHLLGAEQSAFDARIQLLQTRQARLSNRMTLGLALGMGV